MLYFTHPVKSARATKLLPCFWEILADKLAVSCDLLHVVLYVVM